jgi:acetylornithine deacetylase/succinyl-diaminopimelate desuccinylase-like protein
MKGGVTMMVAAILRAAREELIPAGDVLLVVVADEEGGGDWGARWLVEHHPEQFTDVEHAIGEFGGFSLELMGRRFYPIQVSEKQRCWLRTAVHGPGGHGALVGEQLAMRRLADLLGALTGRLLPVHVTPPAGEMIGAIARALPGPARLAAAALSHDSTAPLALRLMGDRSELFQPLLRNTVSPTVVRGGTVTNVVPSRVDLELDGRLLPGFRPSDLLDELTAVVGDDFEFEVTDFEPGPQHTDMRLFDLLAEIVVSQDPEGVPIPMLLSGVTDGRYFARLGIQTYGFIPMSLPPGFGFTSLIHSADERIPLSSLEFGVDTLYELLRRYGRQ